MKKFLVISAIALATFSAFCAGTKKFGKMKDSDWVVTNAWQAMQHRVKPDSEWATNHFGSAEFSNAVGKVQQKVDIPVKSVNGKTGDVILNASDVHALPDTYTPPPETDPTVPAWAKQPNPPEGMTDNALVLTDDKVQTKGGDENLGEASLGTLHVSRIYNNDLRMAGPLYIVSPWMYAFVGKFIIGKTDQNPDGAYNVTIDEAGISAFNGESYFGFSQGRTGMIALENWQSLSSMLDFTASSDLAANQTFSDAVLNVGLNIDTNSVAVLNEIAENFGGFPIEGTATTVGGLLAALSAAIAWLKKNKIGSFASVGGASATVKDGVAKLDDFFTNSNSLLTATIEARLPYPLNAVTDETGLLKDRAINTTSLASVAVPDNFTDLLVRASVESSLSVTMPETVATKYGDTFPGEAGEYLITITKTGTAEAYVRTIKLEVANA